VIVCKTVGSARFFPVVTFKPGSFWDRAIGVSMSPNVGWVEPCEAHYDAVRWAPLRSTRPMSWECHAGQVLVAGRVQYLDAAGFEAEPRSQCVPGESLAMNGAKGAPADDPSKDHGVDDLAVSRATSA